MSYSIFAKEFEHENWDNFISVCIVDTGIRKMLIAQQSEDLGHLIENVV